MMQALADLENPDRGIERKLYQGLPGTWRTFQSMEPPEEAMRGALALELKFHIIGYQSGLIGNVKIMPGLWFHDRGWVTLVGCVAPTWADEVKARWRCSWQAEHGYVATKFSRAGNLGDVYMYAELFDAVWAQRAK